MKKDNQNEVEMFYISGSDLARYFSAKVAKSECLRCGQSEWVLHDTDKVLGTGALLVDSKGVLDPLSPVPGYIPQVSLSCTVCGTMWFLSRGYVVKWLKENPAPAGQDDQDDE